MIKLKTEKEIRKIAYGGKILADVVRQLVKLAKPGVKTIELDLIAEDLIRQAGGAPSFKNYQPNKSEPPFPSTICASINHELVHVPASGRELKNGDIFTIDIGMQYEDLFTDMAVTVPIGKIGKETKRLIKVTKKSLELGIAEAKVGNYIHDISRAIQTYVESNGFTVNKDLVGHGVGYAVHEDPGIPNFIVPNQSKVRLEAGMVLALEPMVNVGSDKVKTLDDGWTVVTADGKLCAHSEHTIAVTEKGPIILTK